MEDACWCGSGQTADECCAPLLDGRSAAPTAEALMRSRYSAYVTMNTSYLLATWHPSTRPAQLDLSPEQKWLGLKVYETVRGRSGDADGIVEFAARFKIGGAGHRLRERSRFVWAEDRWFYLDGEVVGA